MCSPMTTETSLIRERLETLPRAALLTLAVSLLALPGFAFLARRVGVGDLAVVRVAVQWTIALAVVALATRLEGRSLAALGFRRPGWVDLGYLLVTAVATLLVFVATGPLIESLGLPVRDGATAMSAGATLAVALLGAVTTGVVEEILFRGYPIERLIDATGSPLVAGAVTWGAFTLAHAAYWPLGNLLQVSLAAAVLTGAYLRRRNLVPVVGAHVLVWAFAVLGQFYG